MSKCHLSDQILFEQKQNTFIQELTAVKMLKQMGIKK